MNSPQDAAEPPQASTAQELRNLYRAAEARAARLRFIVEMREIIDAKPFEEAAPDILSQLAVFAGAPRATLNVSSSHGRPPLQIAIGRPATSASTSPEIELLSGKDDLTVRVMLGQSAGRPISPDDRQTLEIVMRQIADAVALQRQTAERLDLLRDLQRQRNELSALVARLIEAQEQERVRVGRDLHDGSAQVAAALSYRLQGLAAGIDDGNALKTELDELSVLARRSVSELRHAIADLRPPELDDLGLVAALRARLDALDEIDVIAELDAAAARWPSTTGIVFYRVAQEALTNVVKHAAASKVVLRVFEADGCAHLEVIDDGVGITDAGGSEPERGGRLGIAGMRERLALLGGLLDIGPAPSGGTALRAKAPIAVESRVRP